MHILGRPGIAEFGPELGRNLTIDEWAARELKIRDVKAGDVAPVPIRSSRFGTMSEADGVAR